MMTKTLVWTQFAMKEGLAPKPPEFYVNAGDKMELYIVREESEWPAWDGAGMPRSGALACTSGGECEVVTTDGARGQVCVRWNDGELGVVPIGAVKPRPIRSEEDRITEEFERIMYKPAMTREMAARIYEAIRDGKVPGVKLTGGEG